MSNALWSSLISAGAGLLGAVIGVIGALLASRRASRTAFEQVQYSVRYERKAQVMATAYDKVGIARDKLALLPSYVNNPDYLSESTEEYLKNWREAKEYLIRNAVWNTPEVDQALHDVLQKCDLHWRFFAQVLNSGPSSTDVEQARKTLEAQIKGQVNNQMRGIGHMVQHQLELEKPQRGQ